jgi:hypothetical protein
MTHLQKKHLQLHLQLVCIGKLKSKYLQACVQKLIIIYALRSVSISMVFVNKYLLSSPDLKVKFFFYIHMAKADHKINMDNQVFFVRIYF